MNLRQVIDLYLQDNTPARMEAFGYAKENLEKEIPAEITNLIQKLSNKEPLSSDEIDKMKNALANLDPTTHNTVVGVIKHISNQVFTSYQSKIQNSVDEIDAKLNNHERLEFSDGYSYDEYKGLLNVYLIEDINFKSTNDHSSDSKFPQSMNREGFSTDLMFGINALVLNNKIPKHLDYCEMDLSRPLYIGRDNTDLEKIPERRGIKKSDNFYPYKKVTKITQAGLGNDTYIATNGKKVLYVRDRYSPEASADAVLASQIAAIVSKETFAPESLLDTNVSASKKLPNYISALSNNHKHLRAARAWIKDQNITMPGQGTIDEVLNFIQENDPNTDNFGFTSTDIPSARLVKIDFDMCNVTKPLMVDLQSVYEVNLASSTFGGNTDDAKYIQEKLSARLMLSMFSEKLFDGLAEKAFSGTDEFYEEDKATAVQELLGRSKVSLELFLKHPKAQQFLKDNPDAFNQLLSKFSAYVDSHFDEPKKTEIMKSLMETAKEVHSNVQKEFPDLKIAEPKSSPQIAVAENKSSNNTILQRLQQKTQQPDKTNRNWISGKLEAQDLSKSSTHISLSSNRTNMPPAEPPPLQAAKNIKKTFPPPVALPAKEKKLFGIFRISRIGSDSQVPAVQVKAKNDSSKTLQTDPSPEILKKRK